MTAVILKPKINSEVQTITKNSPKKSVQLLQKNART
jgi:hypothetical protein